MLTPLAERLRASCLKKEEEKVLLARLDCSTQVADISKPTNCNGIGRIHHFRMESDPRWLRNPLPNEPAAGALGLPCLETLEVQVFQLAACNFRCWYCYVPDELLVGDENKGVWSSPAQLLDILVSEDSLPRVIDLSGGQPDIVPEWTVWWARLLEERDLGSKFFLWSDDNLSTDFFWRYLSPGDIDVLRRFQNYAKVCCLKGIDEESFAFNTLTHASGFRTQLELLARTLGLGLQVYCYVTLTVSSTKSLPHRVAFFMDYLQRIHPNLPLRTIPLRIMEFGPTTERLNDVRSRALKAQYDVLDEWRSELQKRFSSHERAAPIISVPLRL